MKMKDLQRWVYSLDKTIRGAMQDIDMIKSELGKPDLPPCLICGDNSGEPHMCPGARKRPAVLDTVDISRQDCGSFPGRTLEEKAFVTSIVVTKHSGPDAPHSTAHGVARTLKARLKTSPNPEAYRRDIDRGVAAALVYKLTGELVMIDDIVFDDEVWS